MSTPRQPRETRAGLEPLAVLPVFVPLQGKRAVLAGSNGGAPWKVKLLAAAGAHVDVYAAEPSEEMRGVPAEIVAGSVTLHERAWTPDDLWGAAFCIGAMEDEAECVAFVACARGTGAIVNAVDRPHLCDVKFGAIVNRSPLVVGISTEGAVPVFGQTVRARIEAMLPRGFARWVAAARDWREGVTARFHGFAERRGFWERFTDMAFAEPDRAPTDADLERLLAQTESAPKGGAVTLVGAGPGDAELLTLKALRALRNADVILYDDLVAPEILDYARREARTMLVGKTGHGPSCRQDDINALMVQLAKSGKQVVRLKSGDPLVFGRAGEEIEACRQAGIPVAVVPGVSAAQGAAASLGVSLTHRDTARRLQYVTGHDRRGALPDDLNWGALADPSVTTVVYMPKRTLRALLERAVAEGLAPETPALTVFNATRPNQAAVRGTAADLADRVEAAGLEGPAILMVGEAFSEQRGGWSKTRRWSASQAETRFRYVGFAMSWPTCIERGILAIMRAATMTPGESVPLGIGYYTVPEAARLLRVPARNINRWLGGYTYTSNGIATEMPPLWEPELPAYGSHIELGFRDLVELRFVNAFMAAGLGLLTIRNCIAFARDCVHDDRPFSTRRFRTDGRTIFLESVHVTGQSDVLDLKKGQYVLKATIERTFRDLDIADDTVTRWRPHQGRKSVVIDPTCAFGQPIVTDYGVPTIALAEAAEAEGSPERAAFLYDLPLRIVREAMQFEAYLRAA